MKKTAAGVIAAAMLLGSGYISENDRSYIIKANADETAVNPVISRGVPAYSEKTANASAANDDFYYTLWNSSAGDYIAYDLSGIPQEQRKTVLAAWYNLSSYDSLGSYVSRNAEPIDYTIEINKAEGGSCPTTGWEIAETVTDNSYSSRQHIVDMEGYNWIRMNISRSFGDTVSLNLDIHDASQGVFDSWIFFGDSITAGGMVNAYGTSYAKYVNDIDSRFFPAQENGGIGGITSLDGRDNIDRWLSTCNAHFVSIAYGTNDCWGNPNNTQSYYDNTKYMIDAVLEAGKVPVLPKIPSSTNADVGPNVQYYNAMVEKLYDEYGNKLVHGPDFDKFFKENEWGLSGDGVHPSSEGYEAMKKLWAETMYENVYSKFESMPSDDEKKIGDANCDGTVTLADAVLILQSISNADRYGVGGSDESAITAQGMINADCYDTGSGVTTNDALAVQKYCIKLVESLPIEA